MPLPSAQHGSFSAYCCSRKGRDLSRFSLRKVCVEMEKKRGIGQSPQARGIVDHAIADARDKYDSTVEVMIP